ncbi:MAG: NlpC/P60 family protein [Oscillospiraceae bacterium]
MANYKLISHAGSGKLLNIYGSGQASNHRNVCLWSDSATKEQQWSIASLSGGTKVLSALNTAYGLNIWRGKDNINNCDIYPVSGNEKDSSITVSSVTPHVYRFKLTNYNLYLTAKGSVDGSDVRWEESNSTTSQQWKAVKVDGGDDEDRPTDTINVNTLKSNIIAYTDFAYNSGKIQLPYSYAKKWTPAQIYTNITNLLGASAATSSIAVVQQTATTNPERCGLDCSGLTYYCLNEASNGTARTFYEQKLNLSGTLSYAYGISAANMTKVTFGTKITKANDVKPGDLIRFNNGGHVGIIYETEKNENAVTKVRYAHSNGSYGPHKAEITIGNVNNDIGGIGQIWNDPAYTQEYVHSIYEYVIRLGCFN